jgi:tetratricopeptide (TPR) repeat protein
MRKYLFAVIILISFHSSFSQTDEEKIQIKTQRHKIDSLKNALSNLRDSFRVDCLNALANQFFYPGLSLKDIADSMQLFATEANSEATKIGYKKGLAFSYLRLAGVEDYRNDFYFETNNKNNPSFLDAEEKYIRQAISLGEELNENRILCNSYKELSDLEIVKENFAAASSYEKKSIEYLKKTGGEKDRLADAYSYLAWIDFRRYDYPGSVDASKKAIALYDEIGDKESEITILTELSKVYEIPGDFENGIESSKKSISLAETFSHDKLTRWSGMAFFWMSRLYQISGDYETALGIIRRGRNFFPNPIDSVSNAFWTATIGNVHRLMKNYDSAKYYLEPFKTTTLDPNNFGKSHLANLYINLKEYDKALEVINPFVQYLKDLHRVTVPLAAGLMTSANAYLGKRNYQTALQTAREALVDLKFINGQLLMIDNYKLLSEIFHNLGKNDSAYFYLSQYSVLKDSLLNRQFYFRLNAYKKEAEEERKTGQINLLNKENQLKESKLKQQTTVKNSLIAGLVLLALLGTFIFRNQSLKRKNERLRLQKEMELKEMESKKKHVELQQQSTELQMQALRAQMNPHFIFNCLSSINKFILKNESQAASDYLTRFSRLIRRVLTNSQLSMIPLSDEIEMLRLYFDMERLRFDNAFDYNIVYANTIEPETIYIPPMLLQPFCENAIWHGLMHKQEQGKLDIQMRTENDQLHCTISDNGVGRTKAGELKSKSGEKEKSFGLKITSERLALFNNDKSFHGSYHSEDILDEQGDVAGTRVSITIKYKDAIHELINS